MFWKIKLRETFGGQGSGNFGHVGRPGEVGGSGEGEWASGTPNPLTDREQKTIKQWGLKNRHDAEITASQRAALVEYRRSTAFDVNAFLRGETTTMDKVDIDRITGHIDAAIAKASLDKNVTVYRGIPMDLHLETGDILRDPAFLSTTFNPEQAVFNFSMGPGNKSTVLQIEVPKGHHGLYTEGLAPRGYEMGAGQEQELLLPRNTKIHITGVVNRQNTYYATGKVVR